MGVTMVNLDDLYLWFDRNRDSVIKGHYGEHVLLKDNAVIAYFSNENEALESAQKADFSMGEFLIQECVSKEKESMYYYNEAVTFG
jgi:hypothetical protein